MQFDFLMSFIVAVLSFLVATVGSYYSRHSFLLNLKTFEKDKKRSEKAKYYHDTYINKPPSFKASPFRQQIDSDDLNESVKLPFQFTDFLIKNYPNRYFYFVALLNKSWSYFEVSKDGENQTITCKIKNIKWHKVKYFLLYITFAMTTSSLVIYNDFILNKVVIDSGLGTLVILCFFIIISITFTIHSLFKLTQMTDIETLVNEFKNAP